MCITIMSENDIEVNLKELLENESREERKANGRLVAVIVASFLIFLAIYHAWIRNTTVLAGILVPALIMILYGGWVVILAKRDKRKRQLFEKKIEEVARTQKKNKAELLESQKKSTATKLNSTQLTSKDEKPRSKEEKTSTSKHNSRPTTSGPVIKSKKSSKTSSPHRKKIKTKRPSIRQKLFRQNVVIETPTAKIVISCKEGQKKHPFVRTASVP